MSEGSAGAPDDRNPETVLDLGTGAGFDCFLAAREVGESGHAVGVDMTPEMVSKARASTSLSHRRRRAPSSCGSGTATATTATTSGRRLSRHENPRGPTSDDTCAATTASRSGVGVAPRCRSRDSRQLLTGPADEIVHSCYRLARAESLFAGGHDEAVGRYRASGADGGQSIAT